jgi:hypothetical protein
MASPGWGQSNQTVGTGCWTTNPSIDTEDVTPGDGPASCITSVLPGFKAWYVVSGDADGEDNVNANEDDGDRDSARLDVGACHSITTQMVKLVGDASTFAGILMMDVPFRDPVTQAITANISSPACADIDYDGDIDSSDCAPIDGDTGIDQDGSGAGLNDSLWWDWGPLPADYVWFDVTTVPAAGKIGVFVVSCGGPRTH